MTLQLRPGWFSPMEDDRLGVSEGVLYRPVDDRGGILLDLDRRRYFALDTVAARAWEVLATTGSLERTIDVLLGEFDADRDALAHDMAELCQEFVAAGWLIHGGATASRPPSR